MDAVVVIFTHPPDYPRAEIATRSAQRCGLGVTWAIDQHDTTDGIPPSITIIRSTMPRHGNLRGTQWASEQLAIMAEVGKNHKWVIKLDSDSIIFRLDWLESATDSHDMAGTFVQTFFGWKLYGGCYAVRVNAIAEVVEKVVKLPTDTHSNEDHLIGDLFTPDKTHAHRFDPARGMMAGWIWNESQTRDDLIHRFSVITVNEDPRQEKQNRRDESLRCMRWLFQPFDTSAEACT